MTTSSWNHNFKVVLHDGTIRKFTVAEGEKMQGLPVGYTKDVSVNQSFKLLGNGWTIPVIEHILQPLKANVMKKEGCHE